MTSIECVKRTKGGEYISGHLTNIYPPDARKRGFEKEQFPDKLHEYSAYFHSFIFFRKGRLLAQPGSYRGSICIKTTAALEIEKIKKLHCDTGN